MVEACAGRRRPSRRVLPGPAASPTSFGSRRSSTRAASAACYLVTGHVKWHRPPEYYAGSRWRGRRALDGGGAVMNQGIHTLDLLLWLLGDVSRVYAATRTAAHVIEVEDTAVATLEFASDAVGTYEATTTAWPGYRRRVEISGDQGTIVIEHDRVIAADLKPGAQPFEVSAAASSAESAGLAGGVGREPAPARDRGLPRSPPDRPSSRLRRPRGPAQRRPRRGPLRIGSDERAGSALRRSLSAASLTARPRGPPVPRARPPPPAPRGPPRWFGS